MLDIEQIRQFHDEAWLASQDCRERAADDLIFSRVTQWGDQLLGTQLEYRGQFDLIRKARRKNLGEMRANPVQVSYRPGQGGDEATADLLENLYRHDMSTPASKQAIIIAQQDQLDCGYGAWKVCTDYTDSLHNEQYIRRDPIHEANNRLLVDPDSNNPDGSDARYMSLIWSVTEKGWPAFAEQIGADPDNTPSSWAIPEDAGFPWYSNQGGPKTYYVGEFYHKEKVTRLAYVFTAAETGEERVIKEEDVDDIFDELVEQGFSFTEEREYETHEVTRYWVDGGGQLTEPEAVAGTMIPIVLLYGEVAKVDGYWIWEGMVRLAKDPQMLRNFMMSYLADIAARGAKQLPYFGLSQIEGLEWQFEEGGPDETSAYRVLNDFDDDGNPLPTGPAGYEQTPQVPQPVADLLALTAESVNDVTSPGVPQDVAGSDLSGKAALALQSQVDAQTYVYLDNVALALQREAEIYASMVPSIYDTPRKLGTMTEEGDESTEDVNQHIMDWDSGKMVRVYDLTQGEYQVRTKISPAFQSRKAQERAEKVELYAASQGDPAAQSVLLLEIMMLADDNNGPSGTFARRKLLSQGLIEPETEEDEQFLAEQEQAEDEPDALTIAAMAEDKKAQADLMDAQTKQLSAQTDQFEAETNRAKVEIEAAKAGVAIKTSQVEARYTTAKTAAVLKDMETREVTIDLSAEA